MPQASRETQNAAEWLDQGLVAITQQDFASARAAFEQARALAPDRPDAYLNLGSLAQAQQQHEEAVSWYDQALICEPAHWQARYCRALSLTTLQRWESALADLSQVIAQDPTQAEPYFNRGYVAQILGHTELARRDFETFLQTPGAMPELMDQARRWLAALSSEQTDLKPEVRLQLARQAYLAGDGGTALRHYDAVLSQEPHHREALLARAHLYAVLEQDEAARQDLGQLLKDRPDDGELWYHQAVLQRRWGEREAAWASLEKAKELAPNLPEIHQEQGILCQEQAPSLAIACYSEALRLDPGLSEGWLARADLYRQRGQDLLAVADYRRALQIDSTLVAAYDGIDAVLRRFSQRIEESPGLTRPYIARANLYQQLGRLEEALQDWSEGARLDPRNPLLMAGRAQVLAHLQQYPAAHAEYTRAIEFDPEQADFYYERAEVLVAMLRPQPALADLDRAVALAPEKGSYYLLRGKLFRQLEHSEAALADLDQALALSPELAEGWRERAVLHLMTQDLPQALRDYQRAVSLAPSADLHRDCAAVAQALDQDALALDHLNQALRLAPDQIDAMMERAELLLDQGDYERSLKDLDKILDQEPSLQEPWLWRARVQVYLRRWEAAASDASRALVRDATMLEAYYLRGVSYFEMGTYAQAARDLRRYLQTSPHAPNREQVLRLIRLADSHQRPRKKAWWRR